METWQSCIILSFGEMSRRDEETGIERAFSVLDKTWPGKSDELWPFYNDDTEQSPEFNKLLS